MTSTNRLETGNETVNRRMDAAEKKSKQKKGSCGFCKGTDHNVKTCPDYKKAQAAAILAAQRTRAAELAASTGRLRQLFLANSSRRISQEIFRRQVFLTTFQRNPSQLTTLRRRPLPRLHNCRLLNLGRDLRQVATPTLPPEYIARNIPRSQLLPHGSRRLPKTAITPIQDNRLKGPFETLRRLRARSSVIVVYTRSGNSRISGPISDAGTKKTSTNSVEEQKKADYLLQKTSAVNNNSNNNNNNNNNMPRIPGTVGAGAPQKRAADDHVVYPLPDSHSDIPPADFEVKNIIECAREFGNTDLYIFDPRKATLAHWWADMAEDQKRWTKTPASKRKDFPTPKIGKDWKAIRCSTGAYLIPPTGKKLAEINLDLELQKMLIKEEARPFLPEDPPEDFLELCEPGRTGIDEPAINGWLAKYRGGWRVACTHCDTKYADVGKGHRDFRARDGFRQFELKISADAESKWKDPLAFTCSYGDLVLCRAAIPLAKSSAFSSCGRCKSLGDTCTDPGGDAKDDWDFDLKDDSQSAILRVAKYIRGFYLGHYELKHEKLSAAKEAFEVLRDACCHDFQLPAIDGVVQEHGADPSEEVVRILTAAIDGMTSSRGRGARGTTWKEETRLNAARTCKAAEPRERHSTNATFPPGLCRVVTHVFPHPIPSPPLALEPGQITRFTRVRLRHPPSPPFSARYRFRASGRRDRSAIITFASETDEDKSMCFTTVTTDTLNTDLLLRASSQC
ncbi:hypothetical protein HD553DRAFT_355024 [Filobasidium floriforme]|uniref:uncharacterized protein n=1 Tax=Filobasidium floriforme TaxID=5210 RepID=UPI001E8D587F|nr:uncharacterized protein HD553DRAFT_355024 [Filobasidium floriforme]KAH8085204.1 hypothetical protein HD553DRAFT_355024 [Filobasidium floriforme]